MLIVRPKTLLLLNLLCLIWAAGGFFVLIAPLAGTEPGVDAVIHGHHRNSSHLEKLLDQLDADGVTWLRERTSWSNRLEPGSAPSDARATWKELKDRGFSIVTYTRGVRRSEARAYPAIDLGIDLFETYRRAAWMAYSHFGTVDAWELLNEGENIFVRDLPDRASSWEKAVYLGLKAGAQQRFVQANDDLIPAYNAFAPDAYTQDAIEAVPVLLGAFAGLPDVHYYEVKAQNDFDAYGDAWNLHHYGWPGNFADLIESHRISLRRWGASSDLPLWLTEYGNYRGEIESRLPEAHREQAAYFRATTSMAIEERIAVTMPFILRWQLMPGFSLFDASSTPYLPWEAYLSTFKSKKHQGVPPPLFQPPAPVSPLVLQWIADPATAGTNKHNGTYRFQAVRSREDGWRPIEGTLKLYNFSDQTVRGRLQWEMPDGFEAVILKDATGPGETRSRQHRGQEVAVPAMENVTFKLRLFSRASSTDHYQKGHFSATFHPTTPTPSHPGTLLFFPVETRPRWDQFTSLPLQFSETPENLRMRPPAEKQEFLSQRHQGTKVGSAVSADRNGALSGPPLPIWIEEDADPELMRFEDLAEEGKKRFTTETRSAQRKDLEPQKAQNSQNADQIRDHSRSFAVETEHSPLHHPTTPPLQHSLTLAPSGVTARGLLDWHNRDYPYGYEWTSQSGVWSGMNRLEVEDLGVDAGTFAKVKLDLKALHPHSQKKPRAVAKLPNGLPSDGWIGIIANRTFNAGFNLQVFLIDKWGQRWTIDEQLVSNPHLVGFEKFLKLADFDKTYFGNILPGATFRPEDVVEIQLHPHGLENSPNPVDLAITLMRPHEAE